MRTHTNLRDMLSPPMPSTSSAKSCLGEKGFSESRKVRTAQYSSRCGTSDNLDSANDILKRPSNASLNESTVKGGGFVSTIVLMSRRQVKVLEDFAILGFFLW